MTQDGQTRLHMTASGRMQRECSQCHWAPTALTAVMLYAESCSTIETFVDNCDNMMQDGQTLLHVTASGRMQRMLVGTNSIHSDGF